MNDLLGSQKIGVIGWFFVVTDDILYRGNQFCEMSRAEMPVMVLPEIGIICFDLRTVEMNPEQFPGVFIRTYVGVFSRTVEKKTVPCVGSPRDHTTLG